MTVARIYRGDARATTLAASIDGVVTSFTVSAGANLPTSGPFILTVDRAGGVGATPGSEERMLVGAISGNSLSSVTRGYDGTTATTHNALAPAEHTSGAVDFAEANAVTVRAPSGSAALVDVSTAQTLSGKIIAFNASGINGDGSGTIYIGTTSGGQLYVTPANALHVPSGSMFIGSTDIGAALTSYTPSIFGNVTSPAGVFAYQLIGKRLHIRGALQGTATATAVVTVRLPPGVLTVAAPAQPITANWNNITVTANTSGPASTVIQIYADSSGNPFTAGATLNLLTFNGVIEVA